MIATGILILMIIGLFAALYPEDSLLRAPNGEIASFQAPIMQSIVAVIFIFAAAVGLVYGILCGKFRSPKDVTAAMEEITKTLVQMVVFYFFAAQFLYAFGASNIGVLLAVSGAEFLKSLALPPQITIFGHYNFCRPAEPYHHFCICKMGNFSAYFCAYADGSRHCA